MLSRVLLVLTICVSGYAVVPETLSESDITAFLSGHNKLRSSLNFPDLVWNSTLATFAGNNVSPCIDRNTLSEYGENLFVSSPKSTNNVQIANDAINTWAAEAKTVDAKWACIFSRQRGCGYYTQVVWRNTTSVGCAIAHCSGPALSNFVICEYFPKGNIRGQIPY